MHSSPSSTKCRSLTRRLFPHAFFMKLRSSSSSSAIKITIDSLLLSISDFSLVPSSRHCHDKGRALTQYASRGSLAAMVFGYSATDCQAYARPLICSAAVQALEHGEDAVHVLLVEPDTVVFDSDSTEGRRRSVTI